jgi:hypothetical protein
MSMVTRTHESSEKPANADAGEPVITEEMIEAGQRELDRYNPEAWNDNDVLIGIYRAMYRLRERSASSP